MNASRKTPYKVVLLDCPELNDSQRAAAELRFRMTIEAALGGADAVLPTLQAYMLAQMLADEDPEDLEDAEGLDDVDSDTDDEDPDDKVEAHVIELWENAEAEAIMLAMKPLDEAFVNARFQIVPL